MNLVHNDEDRAKGLDCHSRLGMTQATHQLRDMRLLPGKLPVALLQRLLRLHGAPDRRVVLGPTFGEDAAVIDLGSQYLILKSDPVTFTADEIGWYAVHVNANDVAVMGARPAWFQGTVSRWT